MSTISYPKNKWIRNPKVGDLYLYCLRRQWFKLGKIIGLVLNSDISCKIPVRLFIPHPFGIIVGKQCELSNDVVLMQQVTLGARRPYYNEIEAFGYPILREGVYVSPGAKILGRVTIGEWSVIGANAVITTDVPPYSIAVEHNKILNKKSTEL